MPLVRKSLFFALTVVIILAAKLLDSRPVRLAQIEDVWMLLDRPTTEAEEHHISHEDLMQYQGSLQALLQPSRRPLDRQEAAVNELQHATEHTEQEFRLNTIRKGLYEDKRYPGIWFSSSDQLAAVINWYRAKLRVYLSHNIDRREIDEIAWRTAQEVVDRGPINKLPYRNLPRTQSDGDGVPRPTTGYAGSTSSGPRSLLDFKLGDYKFKLRRPKEAHMAEEVASSWIPEPGTDLHQPSMVLHHLLAMPAVSYNAAPRIWVGDVYMPAAIS